ncbi:MAG TPA: hypothetical protein VGK86_10045 [Thermoanaerobaculia bacterium]|jgi:hypothetical protein
MTINLQAWNNVFGQAILATTVVGALVPPASIACGKGSVGPVP